MKNKISGNLLCPALFVAAFTWGCSGGSGSAGTEKKAINLEYLQSKAWKSVEDGMDRSAAEASVWFISVEGKNVVMTGGLTGILNEKGDTLTISNGAHWAAH